MKKVFLSIFLFTLVTIFYAQNKVTTIQVLLGYTTMLTDLVVYEDTIYEAQLALSTNDDDDPINIFINKYIDTKYDSTLSIDLPYEQFTTGEFRENGSHYDHLRVFPIAKNEICVAVYSCNANHRLSLFRIKDGKILSKKTYDLTNTNSYESSYYAYDGKDTIYFAYEGQEKWNDTHWDNWIMSFDLDGNVKKYVKIYSTDSDSITDIVAFPDYVYLVYDLGRYTKTEMKALVQLTTDLQVVKVYPYNFGKGTHSNIFLKKHNNNLVIDYYLKNDEGKNQSYISYMTSDGKFTQNYKENSLKNSYADNVYLSYFNYLPEGFISTGYSMSWNNFFNNEISPIIYDSYEYKEFELQKGYIFTDYCEYYSEGKIFMNGKIFLSGSYNYKSTGLSKIAFHTVLENKVPDIDNAPFEFEETDFNFFISESYEDDVEQLRSRWKERLFIKDWKVTEEKCKGSASIIKLDWVTANPDDEEVLATIPVLPFSER